MMVESGGGEVLRAFAMLRRHAPEYLRPDIALLEATYFRGPTSTNQRVDIIAFRQVEATADVVSGLGEHLLANQLWALAARLRRQERGLGASAEPCVCTTEFTCLAAEHDHGPIY